MSLAVVMSIVIDGYKLVVLAAVIMSWIRPDPYNPIVKFVYRMTEPVFSWIRLKLPQSFSGLGIDISPMLVFLLLIFAENFIVGVLHDSGRNLLRQANYSAPTEHAITIDPRDSATDDKPLFQFP